MEASIHANKRAFLTSADLLGIVKAATVRIEFRGEPDRHFNPVEDKVTIFVEGRAEALRVVQGLRAAADKLEALYPLTMENATIQERREDAMRVYEEVMAEEAAVPTRPTRCTRCGINFDRPDDQSTRDGNPRCPECTEAVEDERARADAAEGHPCHREDQ
jgi:predicted Zn-ribbon and HTH transcriptional regulator